MANFLPISFPLSLFPLIICPALPCPALQSAEDLAVAEQNTPFLDALSAFRSRLEPGHEGTDATLTALKKTLLDKYTFIHNPTMMVTKWKANFKVPAYVFADHHVGELPEGMRIHEHLIGPLIDEGYSLKTGVDALKCIDFAMEQANINENRRAKLLEADPHSEWEPVDKAALTAFKLKKVRRGVKRGEGEAEAEGA